LSTSISHFLNQKEKFHPGLFILLFNFNSHASGEYIFCMILFPKSKENRRQNAIG
jgi:hypothetical protein